MTNRLPYFTLLLFLLLLEGLVVKTAAASVIAAGSSHTIALKNDGTVWTWGYNDYGQLGDGTSTERLIPVQVSGLSGVTAVAAGDSHSLALKSDGTVRGWGDDFDGQLGDGNSGRRLTPVQVLGLTGVTAVAGGRSHSVALKGDGSVWTFGDNYYGQLGDGTTLNKRSTAVEVTGLTGVTAVAAGNTHTVALKSNGTVWAWGNNSSGQLGDDSWTQRPTPVQVAVVTGIIAIAAGDDHTLALRNDGTVWTWGNNTAGQLGDGTYITQKIPVQVQGLAGVTAVAAGGGHSLALRTDGTIRSWGYDYFGQLGDGNTASQTSQTTQVIGLTGATAVAGGGSHSLALRNDGTMWSWGYNNHGQLGDGTTTQQPTPVQVQPLVVRYLLSLTVAGTGAGSVTSAPAGISCTTGTCSSTFTAGTTVTLLQAASNGSKFAGWSGACAGSGECKPVLTNAQTVTATFNTLPNARIEGKTQLYGTLQQAYNAATTGSTIQVLDMTTVENVVLALPTDVTVAGGYDSTFTTQSGYTALQGMLAVETGSLIVDHLAIQ